MQLVVPSAVRNAVSAATTIFTTNSITLCFFMDLIFQFSISNLVRVAVGTASAVVATGITSRVATSVRAALVLT